MPPMPPRKSSPLVFQVPSAGQLLPQLPSGSRDQPTVYRRAPRSGSPKSFHGKRYRGACIVALSVNVACAALLNAGAKFARASSIETPAPTANSRCAVCVVNYPLCLSRQAYRVRSAAQYLLRQVPLSTLVVPVCSNLPLAC